MPGCSRSGNSMTRAASRRWRPRCSPTPVRGGTVAIAASPGFARRCSRVSPATRPGTIATAAGGNRRRRGGTGQAASTGQMGRSETGAMTSRANLTALADVSGRWVDRVQTRRAARALVLDTDSSVSPTYGEQEGTAYNGHFECTCYHPLFVFNQDGDLERCALRPGNVHSAHGWRDVLDPVVARYRGRALRAFTTRRCGLRAPG